MRLNVDQPSSLTKTPIAAIASGRYPLDPESNLNFIKLVFRDLNACNFYCFLCYLYDILLFL